MPYLGAACALLFLAKRIRRVSVATAYRLLQATAAAQHDPAALLRRAPPVVPPARARSGTRWQTSQAGALTMKTAPNARALSPFTCLGGVASHIDELRPNPATPRLHGAEVIARLHHPAHDLGRAHHRAGQHAAHHRRARATSKPRGSSRGGGVEVDGILRGGADHLFAADAPGPGMVPVRPWTWATPRPTQ